MMVKLSAKHRNIKSNVLIKLLNGVLIGIIIFNLVIDCFTFIRFIPITNFTLRNRNSADRVALET